MHISYSYEPGTSTCGSKYTSELAWKLEGPNSQVPTAHRDSRRGCGVSSSVLYAC